VQVATEGPYDSEDPAVARLGRTAGRVDFGSLRIPIPARAQLQVEKGSGELLRAVHVLVPSGRVSLSALAAPRSNPLWRGLSAEIADSLSADGARVRTVWGEWGREVEAGSNGALSRFIGVDGPRWMLYGVATGPADGAAELADVLREMMRKTVVFRGTDPLPVKTVLPLRLPEHLEENVERARDVSAQRRGKAARSGSDRSGSSRSESDGSARSGGSWPAKRADAPRAIGSPGGAVPDPMKAPRRPSDPPVPNRPGRPARPAAEAPPPGRRPAATSPGVAPPPAEAPPRHPGRAIGRPPSSTQPPRGAIPAAAQLPGPGPTIGPLGNAGRPVGRSPVPPAPLPPRRGYTDPGGMSRQPVSGYTDPGGMSRQPVSGYTDPGGMSRQPVSGYTDPGGMSRQPVSGYTDPGGLPRQPVSGYTDTGGGGTGGRGAIPAYGSLPPISGYTDTGGLSRPLGAEATWSLAMPVVNAAQVSQQPAWALLGDAPSFWPDERYRPGDPGDGPVEMSSIDSSLPLEPVSPDPGYGMPASTRLDGLGGTPSDDGWRPVETGRGDGDLGEWSDSESWSSPSGDLLSSTDSLHAVLTHDSAVTRDRQARADRLARHRSTDT
jgi:hypothetical protein